ncbi:MAG: TonB-dependent receptor [Phaeodactylibacter sp.]|nr:TonB-dependent receptor [Phaeodactylibacter sp.]MCB9294690.1 TonB-dependent receptor [Lewinellaceae bacterium]
MNRSIFSFLLLLLTAVSLCAQGGIVKGKVTDAINNEPIAFANILVLGTDKGVTSDIDGNYEIGGLVPGLYDVRATYVGYNEQTSYEIQVTNSKPAIVNFRMEEVVQDLQEVVVKASPFRKTEESPVSLRTIGVAEIQRNPGANRDISRVVQSLPGVTTSASFRNDLIIRGGAPNENRFYLDDVEVPNINHFATQGASGGPVGLINVNFIREVDFFSGAFPANRGNALSSVLNFRQRDGRDDRIGGNFMVSATDIGLTTEGPIGEKATFLFSARRSYLQFLFKALGLPFLPTYNDFQAKVKYRIDKKNELTFIGLGAIDQFELNLEANDDEEQQFLLDQLPVSPQWNYTNGITYKRYGENGFWLFVLSRNMLNNEAEKYFQNDDSSEDNLILRYKSQEAENKLRIEHTQRVGDYKFNYGAGYEYVKYNNRTFNRIFTSAGPQTVNYFSEFDMNKYAFFAQASRKLVDERLVLSLGFRMDANSYSDEMNNPLDQFSPRFSLAYALTERLSFNFNTGIYYQLPPYTILGYQEDGVFVNRQNGIKYVRNNHLVAGLEFNTAANSRITVEGYYKYYNDYPFLLRDSLTLANLGGDFGVVGNEPAVPRSDGRSYGLEFLFQQRLFKGFYGIAAYTLGWSEFEDKNGQFIPSSWDARHIVSLTAGKRFGKDWEVGVNWRYQSGLPGTPFSDASSLVLNWDVNGRGIPNYNLLNTRRNDASNTIDIRVDKKWFFDKWSLNIFLDIENITGNAVGNDQLILDRPLDENGRPVGDGMVVNPEAPMDQQRYRLKTITDATGTPLPSIGLMIEI